VAGYQFLLVMPQYINLAIVLIGLVVAYGALNRFSPILNSGKETKLTFAELKLKYGKLHLMVMVGIVLSTMVFTLIIYWVLNILVTLRLGFLYDVLYVVPPDYKVVLLLAFMLAFLLSGLIFWRVAYYNTLTEWEEYLEFVNMYFRFDAIMVTKNVNRLVSLSAVLLAILVLDWYTTFGDEEIKVNDFLGLGTRKYEYNNIVEVKDVKKRANLLGDIVDQPFCVMTFKDEYQWTNPFISNDQSREILSLVMARTNIYKRELELDTE
jgi:hypothetical protein